MSELTKLDYIANRTAKGTMPGNAKYIFSKTDWGLFKKEAEALFQSELEKAKKDTWYEGFNAGWTECSDPEAFVHEAWEAKTPNPYIVSHQPKQEGSK